MVRALVRLARGAGGEVRTGEPVRSISARKVLTDQGAYPADAVVSGLDNGRLEGLLGTGGKPAGRRLSCSGVAVYAALREELPGSMPPHSVVLPSDPAALHASLEAGEEPEEAMAFVNHYGAGEVYPNGGGTLALLLTAPATGRGYGLGAPLVARGGARVARPA